MDPAEPYFYQVAENNEKFLNKRIQSTDAELVDIIHTNANEAKKGSLTNILDGYYGFWDPLGTVDFYVNGGGPLQDGCLPFKSTSMCKKGIENSSVCSKMALAEVGVSLP